MKKAYVIFCVVLLCKELLASKIIPKLSPISLTSCKDAPQLANLEFRKIDEDGKKAWFGNVTIPTVWDANTEFSWEFNFWKNNDWEKSGRTFKGKLCYYLQKFGGKAWEDTRKHAKPPMDDCPIKPGTYVFDNYVADYSGVILPGMHKGKWLGKITIVKDKKIFCTMAIIDML